MRARAGAASPAEADAPRFRRADDDQVRAVALELLRARPRPYPSQAAFVRDVVRRLRESDPKAVVAGDRLRRIALDTPQMRVRPRFAERADGPAMSQCPVCRGPLDPIVNRTLDGARATLGWRCPRCGYWTHLRRRVPVRYVFERVARRRGATRSGTT
ncbi:MAG TPA: hypothetical protein VFF67_09755 [Thermoplasmata archaeon]|nr:hypothetical protein [Thermoplasmata archaeon]